MGGWAEPESFGCEGLMSGFPLGKSLGICLWFPPGSKPTGLKKPSHSIKSAS